MQSSMSLESLESLLTGYWLSDLPNFASFLYNSMPDLNWVGFYLNDGKNLRLGPFMGQPACLFIPYNKGVCGKSFSTKETVIVDDVHLFEGHIACDSASESEMVIPFFINGKLIGVLDLDAPIKSRFKDTDRIAVENALRTLSKKIESYTSDQFTWCG